LTRRCLFASVIDTTCEQRSRRYHPRSTRERTLAGNSTNRFCASGSRRVPPDFATRRWTRPSPAVPGSTLLFLSSGRARRCERSTSTRHLSSSCDGADERGDAHRTSQPIPLHDRRTFEWRALREEQRAPSVRGTFCRVIEPVWGSIGDLEGSKKRFHQVRLECLCYRS
jgi:hypothetical protein